MNQNNFLKFFFVLIFFSFTVTQAQRTSGDVTQSSTAIKVIDNKGTIKYFQSNNGITMITNTTNNKTTTTWQLGGTLTDSTYIDVNNKPFGLDGLKLETGSSSSDATTGTSHTGTNVGTGWTLLVRDEATAEIRKLKATDLVSGIRVEVTQSADGSGATQDIDITVTGLPTLTAATTAAKLFVFRNGIKLRPTVDYVSSVDKVTVKHHSTNLPIYAGDVFEIQYVK